MTTHLRPPAPPLFVTDDCICQELVLLGLAHSVGEMTCTTIFPFSIFAVAIPSTESILSIRILSFPVVGVERVPVASLLVDGERDLRRVSFIVPNSGRVNTSPVVSLI